MRSEIYKYLFNNQLDVKDFNIGQDVLVDMSSCKIVVSQQVWKQARILELKAELAELESK